MIDLSVIILNWNTREDLSRCLSSLAMNSSLASQLSVGASAISGETASRSDSRNNLPMKASIEVIVVDNHSSDGSPERVRDHFAWAKLIENPENVGFSAGNNRGIEAASGRYIFLLNPDTIVHPGALESLVAFADLHPEAGIVGAKLLNGDDTLQYSCRTFPSLVTGFFRNTPLEKLFPKNRFNRDYLLTDWDHNSPREVDWVSGAAMLLRKEMIEKIGALDERFFMYCEDIDICYRALQAGWKTLFCPDAVINHLIARASDQNVAAMLIVHHKSMFRFFRKHYAKKSNPLIWPAIIAGLALRAAAMVLKNRVDRFRQARQARRRNKIEGAPPRRS